MSHQYRLRAPATVSYDLELKCTLITPGFIDFDEFLFPFFLFLAVVSTSGVTGVVQRE